MLGLNFIVSGASNRDKPTPPLSGDQQNDGGKYSPPSLCVNRINQNAFTFRMALGQESCSCPCPSKHIFNRNDKSEHTTHLDNVVRIIITWSEMGDSNSRPDGPKPMSEPSARGLAHSLALSGTPAVPLWNSIGLFISATAFGFWDLCGIEFCILKVLPTGFTSNSGCFCRREQLRNCAA